MTAPRIANISIPSGEVMYPRRISIIVTFTQNVVYRGFPDRVTFEAKTAYDITTGNNENPSEPVGLGQVEVESRQTAPNQVEFSFQISPFANGPLQLSYRPWNRNFQFRGTNSWDEPVDWSAFLVPGLFESVVQKPFFSWVKVSSPRILYAGDTSNYPKLDKASTCLGTPPANANPGIKLQFGPAPLYPATALYDNFWNEGKFWWWYDICARNGSKDLYAPGARRYYAYSTSGFQITNTSPLGPCPPFPNSGGTNPDTGAPRQYFNYNECNLQTYCVCPWIRTDPPAEWYGRLNTWICSTPDMDYIQPEPTAWYNNVVSSVNDFNLSPWKLASLPGGLVGPSSMLIQCYVAQGWRYQQSNPPDS